MQNLPVYYYGLSWSFSPGGPIMSLSEFQQRTIQEFCLSEPKTVQQITEKLGLSGNKSLMIIYNYLKTQAAKLKFIIGKYSGLIWVRTNPLYTSAVSPRLDNFDKQNSPKTKNDYSKTYKPLKGLVRSGPERTEAALIMNRLNKFGYYNKETKQFVYTTEAKNEIDRLFKDYCNRVKQEKIILSRAPDGNPIFSQDLIINYKTRFTDQGRQQENIEGFRAVYKAASHRFMKGVFLTLTAPYRSSNTLWEVNQNMKQGWDSFRDWLNKYLPKRASWIKVTEFQKNGRIHYHIIIFGINWLDHKGVIQYKWKQRGGGPVLDIHTIRQEPIRGWVWARSSPSEASGQKPGDLLASYLEKSMSQAHGSLYWVMGVRSWTCSKNLLPEKLQPKKPEPIRSPTKRYFLKGVLSSLTGFRSSHRKDSIEFFSGSLKSSPSNPSGPQKAKTPKSKPLDLTFRRATDLSYQC